VRVASGRSLPHSNDARERQSGHCPDPT
jgi:hypothetical protein